jgi:hypothetical protein
MASSTAAVYHGLLRVTKRPSADWSQSTVAERPKGGHTGRRNAHPVAVIPGLERATGGCQRITSRLDVMRMHVQPGSLHTLSSLVPGSERL